MKNIKPLLELKRRELARLEVKLHEPNTLFEILFLLERQHVLKSDIEQLESLLQVNKPMKKKKTKKVNKLKLAKTSKAKKAIKKAKKK